MSALELWISVLLCIQSVLGSASSTTVVPTKSKQSTCPARTINYLTHTLPQQCLPSPRTTVTSSNGAVSATITDGASSSNADVTDRKVEQSVVLSNSVVQALVSANTTLSVTSSSTSSTYSIPILPVTTVTATSVTNTAPVALIPVIADEDSPLESNFLSFEEWKKQNLIKAGQSDHVGRKPGVEQKEPRKKQKSFDNTLDSLGDDAEIELDFSGLVPGGPDTVTDLGEKHANTGSGSRSSKRGKDAGTTSKERFNYASIDCAASVLKTNQEARSPNTVIMENKDSYMLNKCSATNKFIILELCDDISIDTIVLANFEFFSSSFRTFRASVSDKYPIKADKWQTLGMFEARNTREVQAFLVENPVIWARYVRIEFLTHYGNEFYCPVSLIRVHGYTMMEDYKHDLAMTMDDGDDDDDSEDITHAESAEVQAVPKDTSIPVVDEESATVEENQPARNDHVQQADSETCILCAMHETQLGQHDQDISVNTVFAAQKALLAKEGICPSSTSTACTHTTKPSSEAWNSSTTKLKPTSADRKDTGDSVKSSSSVETQQSTSTSSPETQAKRSGPSTTHTSIVDNGNVHSNIPNATTLEHSRQNSSSKENTRAHTNKQSASGTQSHPASPTIQESFFKSVQKRLQSLESNSSLSLQYIEEQSRALRDAFRRVENRQLSKTSTFLEHLNQTVLNELRDFRQQYDHLWQSTVIELEMQRERYQQESQAMHARLGVLADELIFQRRVAIFQMALILICLGLVLFSRGAMHNYLELPLVQSVLSRSPRSRWSTGPEDSRSTTPAMPRTRSAHQLGSKQGILKSHNRALSDESTNEVLSASEMYSPPTPVSFDGFSDAELTKSTTRNEDLEFDPLNIERPNTSPPVLPSVEDQTTPRSVNWSDDISIDSLMLSSPSPKNKMETLPELTIEHPTPPGRHLTWNLPE